MFKTKFKNDKGQWRYTEAYQKWMNIKNKDNISWSNFQDFALWYSEQPKINGRSEMNYFDKVGWLNLPSNIVRFLDRYSGEPPYSKYQKVYSVKIRDLDGVRRSYYCGPDYEKAYSAYWDAIEAKLSDIYYVLVECGFDKSLVNSILDS